MSAQLNNPPQNACNKKFICHNSICSPHLVPQLVSIPSILDTRLHASIGILGRTNLGHTEGFLYVSPHLPLSYGVCLQFLSREGRLVDLCLDCIQQKIAQDSKVTKCGKDRARNKLEHNVILRGLAPFLSTLCRPQKPSHAHKTLHFVCCTTPNAVMRENATLRPETPRWPCETAALGAPAAVTWHVKKHALLHTHRRLLHLNCCL